MARIIAYTYVADVHCPDCTRQASVSGRLTINNHHPHAFDLPTGGVDNDELGIAYNLQDREGNLIHPVFDTDEHGFTHCSDCQAELY